VGMSTDSKGTDGDRPIRLSSVFDSGYLIKGESPESLRVFGRLPFTGVGGCTEAGVRKASREETAGGFRTDAGVDLWGICRRCLS